MRDDWTLNTTEAAKILEDPDAFATTLMTIILSYYKDEENVLDKDTAAIFADLEEDFRITLPEENENRINAAILAITTDLFTTDPQMFCAIADAFSDGSIGDIMTGLLEEPDGGEALWAMFEYSLLTGIESQEMDVYTAPVRRQIMRIMEDEGFDPEEEYDTEELDESDIIDLDELKAEGYYVVYMNKQAARLRRQLLAIGVPKNEVDEALGAME